MSEMAGFDIGSSVSCRGSWISTGSSALSRADSVMPDNLEFPGLGSAEQPKLRGVLSTGACQALGECGVTSIAPNRGTNSRATKPNRSEPTRLLAADVGALPHFLSEGVQFASPFPSTTRAPAAAAPPPRHDTPLEKTDDTAQEGLAARSSCTSIGRIVSVPDRLNNTVAKQHLYRPLLPE